jgi:hypothetical protein
LIVVHTSFEFRIRSMREGPRAYVRTVSTAGEQTCFFPSFRPLVFSSKRIQDFISDSTTPRNDLVARRRLESINERLERIEFKPHFAATAVSRYSSQMPFVALAPGTPASSHDLREGNDDFLSLDRVVKRRKLVPHARQVVKLTQKPALTKVRLSSIKV